MSPDAQFCFDICQAARRLSIYARMEVLEAAKRVVFFDVMAQAKIAGDWSDDGQKALISGCNNLVNYLTRP